jgi:hypothetical protein
LRAAERSVGIPPSKAAPGKGKLRGKAKGKRVRRTTMVRASKAIEVLRRDAEPAGTTTTKARDNKPAGKATADGA